MEIDGDDTATALKVVGDPTPVRSLFELIEKPSGAQVMNVGNLGTVYLASDDTTETALYVEPNVTLDAGKLVARFGDIDATARVQVNRTGYLMLLAPAAPADADIPSGHACLWYDSTNGAAVLNVKAKQANGTVRTAAIPLA